MWQWTYQTINMRQMRWVWLYITTLNATTHYQNLSLDMILRHFHLQQNSCNTTYENSEILIIWHLRRVVPRLEILMFTRRKPVQWNKYISGTFSKRLPEVCTSTIIVSSDPLFPSSTSWTTKLQKKQMWTQMTSEPADGGDIQVEYSSDLLYSPI